MRRVSGFLVAACSAIAAPVSAVDLGYELSAGAAYSNNLERSSVNEIETAIAVAGLRVRGARDEGRLQYAVAGDASYLEYLDSDVSGEVIGSAFANSAYDILPGTFRWELDGSFAQIREDLLRAAAPGNRDSVVNLSTGPTLRARFGEGFEAEWQARYAIAQFSEQEFDSSTVGTQLVLGRRLSERSNIGVGASFADVTYDSASGLGSVDFERREVFVRVRGEGARTSIQADIGYAEAKGANLEDGGALVRLEATRRLSPFVSAFAVYAREYPTSEAAVFIPFDATGGREVGDSSILTATPRLATNAEFGFRLARPRTNAELAFGTRRETDLVGTLGQRSFDTARVSITRALTPRASATAFGFWSREELDLVPGAADELGGGAALSFTFGRNVGIDLRVDYRDRESPLPGFDFSEASAGVFLRWGRIMPGVAAPASGTTALLQVGN